MIKNKLIIIVTIITTMASCQEKNKSDSMNVNKKPSQKIDLLSINFDNDFESLTKTGTYQQKECEITDYLTAIRTSQIDTFSLGNFEFISNFEIKDISIPSKSYLSLISKNRSSDSLLTIRIEYNFIGQEDYIVEKFEKQFGKPKTLSVEGSSNEFRGLKNYLWSNIATNKTLIFSQSSYGSAVGLESDISEKIYTAEIYIIKNDATVTFPNVRTSNILEMVKDKYSE